MALTRVSQSRVHNMTLLRSEAPRVAPPDFGVFHRVADDVPVNALALVTTAACAADAIARLAGRLEPVDKLIAGPQD